MSDHAARELIHPAPTSRVRPGAGCYPTATDGSRGFKPDAATRDARVPDRQAFASSGLAATIVAAAVVAQQVIGKATRDAAAVVWVTTRWVARFGPARIAPIAFAVQGAVVLVEWALASRFESRIALVLYVQTIAVGGTLVSAFWSVVSEGFDPHTVKQVVGRIGPGAALGGIVGGAPLASRLENGTTQRNVKPRPNTRALDDLLLSRDTPQLNIAELRRTQDPDGAYASVNNGMPSRGPSLVSTDGQLSV
jgi:hypothetical protein